MPRSAAPTQLFTFPDLETPLGRVHFGGNLPNSSGTGLNGYRQYGMYAAVLILSGNGIYRDANDREKSLKPGSVIFVFPELPHHYGPPPGQRWDELFVAFSGAPFDAWRAHGLDPAHPAWELKNLNSAARCLRGLLERHVKDFADSLKLASDVHQLLRHWIAQRPKTESQPAWLAHARRSLATPQDLRPLQRIAAETGLHPDAFRRAFRKWTGEAPAEFRRRHRLAQAATLLRRRDLTLSQIAETLGFHDAFHFSKQFREHFGIPPSVYRDRQPQPSGDVIRPV